MNRLKLVECPRDAMQGWSHFIPTALKTEYLNALLQVGFDTLDFGSFVSPKAIPQLADTKEVLRGLDLTNTQTRLLAIIANVRGAEEAVVYDEISYLGFPFSISETFQRLNTNSSISESLNTVEKIQHLCVRHRKEAVTYISMGFGNPYGDEYSPELAIRWVEELSKLGLRIFAISDTVGVSEPGNISRIYHELQQAFPALEFGAHFHSTPERTNEKLEAAWNSGCCRFDSALNGIGGCPMAQNDLVGNIATEKVFEFFSSKGIDTGLHLEALEQALVLAQRVFQTPNV